MMPATPKGSDIKVLHAEDKQRLVCSNGCVINVQIRLSANVLIENVEHKRYQMLHAKEKTTIV